MDKEKLLLYWSDELSPEEREEVATMISTSPEAQLYLSELDGLNQQLQEMEVPSLTRSPLEAALLSEQKSMAQLRALDDPEVAAIKPHPSDLIPADFPIKGRLQWWIPASVAAALVILLVVSPFNPFTKNRTEEPLIVDNKPKESSHADKSRSNRRLSSRLFSSSDRGFSSLRSSRDRRDHLNINQRKT